MSLDSTKLAVQQKPFHVPSLQEIADVLNSSLKLHFADVNVEVVDCPDLTQQPFTLAAAGLNGKPRLAEIGGPPYLLPLVQREKVYNLKDLPQLVGLENAAIIGAGAGPFPYATVNCEGIINLKVTNGVVDQQTRIAKVVNDASIVQEILPSTETRIAVLGNFFVSEGKPGQVLKVHVKKRIGSDDFIASIRKSLVDHYGQDKIVGLGGTFLLKEGKAKQHVMPDFSTTPITSDELLNKWLNFYTMSAPLIAVGTLVTGDYDLDLRVQHFHSFSHHGEAGHYHIDTTPDTVEYLGYFNTAEFIYRVDKPTVTHQFGRD